MRSGYQPKCNKCPSGSCECKAPPPPGKDSAGKWIDINRTRYRPFRNAEMTNNNGDTLKALLPKQEGFYWAKWRIKDAGTEDENEPCPDTWEVVNVFENCMDKTNPEYLRVFVGGVGRSQSLENFYWGEKVTRAPSEKPTGDRVEALDILERGLDEICSYVYDTRLPKNKMRQLIRSTFNVMDKAIRPFLTTQDVQGRE